MGTLKQSEITPETIGEGRTRYLAHTEKLMMAVIDFMDGPTGEPDPPHSHPHEQVSYVVSGELIVFIGDEQTRLAPGDMFTVPPDIPHTVQLLTEYVRLVDTFHPIRDEFLSL
jgi:quercetin dioxygenase-like cupin family protein